MKIRETGRVISINRCKIKDSKYSMFVLTLQSLSKRNVIFRYEKLKTAPYINAENNKLQKIEPGDYLQTGTEIVDGVGYCPECREIIFPEVKKGKTVYACSNSSCTFDALPGEIKGHIVTREDAYKLLTQGETGVIRDFKQKNTTFSGRLYLDEHSLLQLDSSSEK